MAMKGKVWSIDNAFIDIVIWAGKDVAVLLDNDETRQRNSPFCYLAVARDGAWLEGGFGRFFTGNLRINESSVFEPVAIPGDYPTTCGKLTQSGGLMASAGERDLFTFDGLLE